MSLDDLPPDWPTRAVTDPDVLVHLVDLVVTEASRDEGVLYVWLCGPADRLMQPCAVTSVNATTPAERRETIDPFARVLSEQVPDGSLVVVIARPGAPRTTDDDELWRDAAQTVCRSHHLRLAGVVVATREAIWQLPDPGLQAQARSA